MGQIGMWSSEWEIVACAVDNYKSLISEWKVVEWLEESWWWGKEEEAGRGRIRRFWMASPLAAAAATFIPLVKDA